MDFEIISPTLMSKGNMHQNSEPEPISEIYPTCREYGTRLIITKSGPGIMTANKWTITTVRNSEKKSIKLLPSNIITDSRRETPTFRLRCPNSHVANTRMSPT